MLWKFDGHDNMVNNVMKVGQAFVLVVHVDIKVKEVVRESEGEGHSFEDGCLITSSAECEPLGLGAVMDEFLVKA